MFFTASSGVGKSTLAMNMAASLVLKDIWLDFKILERDQKIMYSSTEMNEGDVNYFLSHLNSVLPVEIQEKLDEQVIFYPEGTPIYLNTKEGQTWYEDRLEYNKPTGLIIDTLGASVSTSLTDEKEMRLIADWIDTIRNKLGIWVCILHHYRKASNQTRTGERTLDDMYGAQLIANRAQTVWGLRKMPKDPSILEVQSHKGRFTDTVHGRHMFLRRSSALWLDKDSAFSSKGKQSETVIEDDLGPSSEKDLEI
jgi:hypothetical protein